MLLKEQSVQTVVLHLYSVSIDVVSGRDISVVVSTGRHILDNQYPEYRSDCFVT